MRRLRWLILSTILVIAALIGRVYLDRTEVRAKNKAEPAPELPKGIDIQAQEWTFNQTENGKVKVRLRAKGFSQVKDSSKLLLEGVTLEIPRGDGSHWDQIKTAKAEFDQNGQTLYSEGEVEIIMDVPDGAEPSGKLMKINTSGVRFEKAGKAYTDKPVSFQFDRGEGSGVGATYDVNTRELQLLDQVHLVWKGKDQKAVPLEVDTKHATYKENESVVLLEPWAKLKRASLTMESENAVVKLNNGLIDVVDADKGRGVQDDKGRKIEYAASHLTMKFSDKGQIASADGDGQAKLISTTASGKTDVDCDRINLEFEPQDKDTILRKAWARGNTVIHSQPVARQGAAAPDTRIMKSEVVELRMRADGEEIESAETHAPSELELIPNRAGQPHRWLTGEKFWMTYGAENRLESFRTVKASTKSIKPGDKQVPTLTWSDELRARFDPKTSQMTILDQERNFKYQSGDRQAVSDRASLDQTREIATLTGGVRVWDPTGSTTGDAVEMNQKNGDSVVTGNVTSTRLPNKKAKTKSTAIQNREENTQATAQKMNTLRNNRFIRYEGNAVAWQGSNRVAADWIEMDEDAEVMRASGKVVSQFADKPKKEEPAAGPAVVAAPAGKKKQTSKKSAPKQGAPVFTLVRSDRLVYTTDNQVAVFTGDGKTPARMERPGMTVTGREIRAFLNDGEGEENESSFSRAVAEGTVEIVQTTPGRVRTGTSEHADYYPDDGKIILEGGQPLFTDTQKGRTQGRQLTYFSNDDRLLVDGVEQRLAESVLKRK